MDREQVMGREGAINNDVDETTAAYLEMLDQNELEGEEGRINIDKYIESYVFDVPKFCRVRASGKVYRKPGTSIFEDADGVRWYIKDERYSSDEALSDSVFFERPAPRITKIALFVIERPQDDFNLALSCRAFAETCEKPRLVAHTAAVTTKHARIQQAKANVTAADAREIAGRPTAIDIPWFSGEWRGEDLDGDAISWGLGVYTSDSDNNLRAGRFDRGRLSGPGEIHYSDGSSYAGDVAEDEYHGEGVEWTGTGQRYEGSW